MRGKFTYRSAAALIAALLAAAALSGSAHAAGPVVREIVFTGAVRTPEQTLRSTVRTQVGAPLSEEQLDRDVRDLYRLGQFRHIKVESLPAQGGVRLNFVLDERPLIAEIGFAGNKKIKSDDLRPEVTQRTFSPLDEKAVAESMQRIREAYAKKGYYLAEVNYYIDTTPGGDSKLVFDVHEHKGVMVRRVLFVGNKVFKDKELRKVIKTRQKGAFSFLTGSGKYEEEILKNDMLFLTYYYLNHGYLRAKISPPRTTISKDRRYIFVTYQVHEGEQYRIGRIGLSGDILTTPQELEGALRTKAGEIYSQRTLDTDLMGLTERYGDEGYAYANIVPQTIPDDESLTADIDVRIHKGDRITIERINIAGNNVTRDKVIRRELAVMEDDRFSERGLRKSKENLMRLGYFEDVTFATPRGTRDDTMVLNIDVRERPTGTFNIGAGFSSVEKFMINASIQKQNFLGYGISGQISAELSKRRQLFMLSVSDPYFLDTKMMAGISGYRNAYNYNDFRRAATGGDVSLGRRFFDYYSWQLGYTLEQVSVGNFSYAVPQFFRQNTSGLTSQLSLTLARDTRDNRITPNKGMYNLLTNEVSGNKLGGDNDYYRVNFRTMFYYPIIKDRLIFKEFFRIGYIRSLNDQPVPLFERFFTGGVFSLRGYQPDSVGPSIRIPGSVSGSDQRFVYGGDKILLFITEFEIPIYDKAGIRGVVFFDAGNAFGETENYDIRNLRLDYGFGIRWNSPMGPLRFEWGFPIARKAGEDPVVFNFTIGNFF
ncbi:MAG: outer membrane protein assembly factor BamA [Proteobacteria bacterium]|nr:outer membrane protein assembly factor BamA [Pseudomonadota bacterium]